MLKCLQAGRGIAAIAVVAFHLSMNFDDPRYGLRPMTDFLSRHGNLGVDFFFVLSGFIILNAHFKDIGRPGRWLTYIWRRFARVYPIYWIYVTIMCVLLLVGATRESKPPHDFAAWLSAYSLVRFSPDQPPIIVAWTLFHEIAFYFAFSILILNRWLGMALLAAWACACATLFHYTGPSGYSAFSVYTSAFNLEFFMGMAAYGLFRLKRYPLLLIAGGVATMAAVVLLTSSLGRLDHDLFGLSCALIIAGATILEERRKFATPEFLVSLGGASYTIYLVHVPVEDAIMKFLDLAGVGRMVPSLVLWWSIFLVTVAIAYGGWLVIERPLQAALGRRRKSGGAAAPVSA